MNGLMLLVAGSLSAWVDPTPSPAPAVTIVDAPLVATCPTYAKPCETSNKPSCFDGLKQWNCSWGCMPCVVGHPAPQYHYQPACSCQDNCKPGCLDKLKARFTRSHCGDAPCGSQPCGGDQCEEIPAGAFIANRYGPTPAMMPYLVPTMTPNHGFCRACKACHAEPTTAVCPDAAKGQPVGAVQPPFEVQPAGGVLPATLPD